MGRHQRDTEPSGLGTRVRGPGRAGDLRSRDPGQGLGRGGGAPPGLNGAAMQILGRPGTQGKCKGKTGEEKVLNSELGKEIGGQDTGDADA